MDMCPPNLDSKQSQALPQSQHPHPNAFDNALRKDLLLNSTCIDAAC